MDIIAVNDFVNSTHSVLTQTQAHSSQCQCLAPSNDAALEQLLADVEYVPALSPRVEQLEAACSPVGRDHQTDDYYHIRLECCEVQTARDLWVDHCGRSVDVVLSHPRHVR